MFNFFGLGGPTEGRYNFLVNGHLGVCTLGLLLGNGAWSLFACVSWCRSAKVSRWTADGELCPGTHALSFVLDSKLLLVGSRLIPSTA